jgi:immune inhibitor A
MTKLRALALLALFPVLAPAQAPPKPNDPKPLVANPDRKVGGDEKKEDAKKEEPKKLAPIPGYKTVAELAKADPKTFKEEAPTKPVTPGYLGVAVANGLKPTIDDVAPKSPAETGGLKVGDLITKIGAEEVVSAAAAKERLRGLIADEAVSITIERDKKAMVLSLTPKPTSKPIAAPTTPTSPQPSPRALLGVRVGDVLKDGGVPVDTLTGGGAAEKAGIKEKDVLLEIDGKRITAGNTLTDLLAAKKPGEAVEVTFTRDGKEQKVKATLAADQQGGFGRPGGGFGGLGGWNDAIPSAWKRKDYKLAIIGIEYPDVKHNEKIADKDWEASLFSVGKYTDKSATGQQVFGSMADYYKEISYDNLKVEGKFAGWVEVSKKRMEYSSGSGTSSREKSSLLTEAMDKLLAKDKDALKDADGVFFLYAGGSVPNNTRGSLYWPHRASVRHNNKSWPYFIVQEGGDRMTNISVFCHEFGHMLGLPDLYARPEVPGMEGVGQWCAMSQQIGNGRPQHFSAWSKMQLGWAKPTMIDPRVKQKVVLSPIEDDPTQCVKIPLRTDGGEYLLLENRKKKGWDSELPAEGLLIWRVLPGERGSQPVYLEESHGIEGRGGPNSATGSVPFPSPANDSFTPYTTPSSKAKRGGGFDVFVTNITRHPDGRITFHVGYEYQ